MFVMWCTAFGGGISAIDAQPRKLASSRMESVIQRPRETRPETKREELSKKLMQRKNELRKEEHGHVPDRRSSETHEKSNSPK
jgi:hypothetical protein